MKALVGYVSLTNHPRNRYMSKDKKRRPIEGQQNNHYLPLKRQSHRYNLKKFPLTRAEH